MRKEIKYNKSICFGYALKTYTHWVQVPHTGLLAGISKCLRVCKRLFVVTTCEDMLKTKENGPLNKMGNTDVRRMSAVVLITTSFHDIIITDIG